MATAGMEFAVGTAGFPTSVFNLMNAILGSGIVGLPYALLNLGYIGFFIGLVAVAILALFAVNLLLALCEQENSSSYEDIADRALGKAGKLYTSTMIALHCLIAMCSFMFIVKFEGPPFLQGVANALSGDVRSCEDSVATWYTNSTILVILCLWVIVAPLAMLRRIDFLGYTSGFGMFCMVVFTGIVVTYKFLIDCPVTKEPSCREFLSLVNGSTQECRKNMFTKHALEFHALIVPGHPLHANSSHHGPGQICEPIAFNWTPNSIYAVPTMVFAFQCHASTLPIYAELKIRTRDQMMKVGVAAIGSVWTIYALVSFCAYFTFYNVTMPEVLQMYAALDPADPMILLARGCALTCVILSAPLLHFPLRRTQLMIIFGNDDFQLVRHVLFAIINLVVVTLIVIFLDDIKVLFSYGGSITANSLVIILPALCYYKLIVQKGKSTKLLGIVCPVLAVAGVVFMIMNIVLDLVKKFG